MSPFLVQYSLLQISPPSDGHRQIAACDRSWLPRHPRRRGPAPMPLITARRASGWIGLFHGLPCRSLICGFAAGYEAACALLASEPTERASPSHNVGWTHDFVNQVRRTVGRDASGRRLSSPPAPDRTKSGIEAGKRNDAQRGTEAREIQGGIMSRKSSVVLAAALLCAGLPASARSCPTDPARNWPRRTATPVTLC